MCFRRLNYSIGIHIACLSFSIQMVLSMRLFFCYRFLAAGFSSLLLLGATTKAALKAMQYLPFECLHLNGAKKDSENIELYN